MQWIRALNYNVDSLGFKFFLYPAAGVVPGSLMFYSTASWGFPEVNIV